MWFAVTEIIGKQKVPKLVNSESLTEIEPDGDRTILSGYGDISLHIAEPIEYVADKLAIGEEEVLKAAAPPQQISHINSQQSQQVTPLVRP
jgi:hypothetical protein